MRCIWVVLCLVVSVLCVQFDIPIGALKCISEEYSGGILVKGRYGSPQEAEVTLFVSITDATGTEIHSSNDNQGTFAFTTDGAGGTYMFCFRHNPEPGGRLHYSYNRRVTLEVSSGVDTTDFAKVARDEHLNKMELEALKIQRNLEEVVGDLGYFKRREERHRDTNESTNGRVMWFSLVSMGIIVAIGSWQLLYLRRFFTQKKLI